MEAPSLSELPPIISHMELIHSGWEASMFDIYPKTLFIMNFFSNFYFKFDYSEKGTRSNFNDTSNTTYENCKAKWCNYNSCFIVDMPLCYTFSLFWLILYVNMRDKVLDKEWDILVFP